MRKCRLQCLVKVNFEEIKNGSGFPKYPFLVLARDTIMLQHLIIHFSVHYLSSGRLMKVKNKGKFQTFSSKSGRGLLRDVAAYKFQI